ITPKTLPLYGSEHLPSWPMDTRIVITEGEKAAAAVLNAHRHALAIYGATTIPVRAVLELLRDRHLILSPDNDDPGRHAMQRLAADLRGIAASVLWLEPPDGSPKGWDLADALEGRDATAVLRELAPRIGPVPDGGTNVPASPTQGIDAADLLAL